MTDRAVTPIVSAERGVVGHLRVMLLPETPVASDNAPLLDLTDDPDRDPSMEPIQLLEGSEYRYEILTEGVPTPITTDRPEVFTRDSESGTSGRLRPGLYTGTLPLTIFSGQLEVGRAKLEVRSKKLDYLRDYRWMLRDVAEAVAEVVMRRFAPTEQRFRIDSSRDAATLYQRFAFLRSLVTGDAFEAAVREILGRPYVAWEEVEELRHPAQGVAVSSRVARQLVAPGPRSAAAAIDVCGRSLPLPAVMRVYVTQSALDNAPNRFVKFALSRWRELLNVLDDALRGLVPSAVTERGTREIRVVADRLDSMLAEGLFREVGALNHFPADNQVLQKREGYRDVLQAYLLCEVAAQLSWRGGDDVYGAGQKDVAALYEYWILLQLASAVGDLCGASFDASSLVSEGEDGLGLDLRRGHRKVLAGTTSRLGRDMAVELWYNRTFGSGGSDSWTRPMRPDCSLSIRPAAGSDATFEPVWLHFDAKYRVETLLDLLGQPAQTDGEEEEVANAESSAERRGEAKRADLLRMHAYRDAIRRSAGAYVLYPGAELMRFEEYHEILPGLGAFALRPTETGAATGVSALTGFLNDVLTHVASQITQHERGRYWVKESFDPVSIVRESVASVPFLSRPPADTNVLLGYVKSARHLEWIRANRRYNVRADDRTGAVGLGSKELAADLVLTYQRDGGVIQLWKTAGSPELLSREQMVASGYPSPKGKLYYCVPLAEEVTGTWSKRLSLSAVLETRRRVNPQAPAGAPVATTWLELFR